MAKISQDAPAERAVLGSCLCDVRAAVYAADFLKSTDFYDERHRAIFDAIRELVGEGGAEPDLILLVSRLESSGNIDKAGGFAYVATIVDDLPDATNIQHYAALVKAASDRRVLSLIGMMLSQEASDNRLSPREIADDATQQILRVMSHSDKRGARLVGEIADDERERIQRLSEQHGPSAMVMSGFQHIDAMLGGFDAEQLIVLAAMTGVGKTALALQIAGNAASAGKKVLYHSLEMSDEQLVRRMLSRATGISATRLKYARLVNDEVRGGMNDFEALSGGVETLKQFKLWLDGRASVSVEDIRATARRLQMSEGLDMIVVDYLQLVRPPSSENRVQQVSAISRGLKMLAKDLRVPVLALSQLNRAADYRQAEAEPGKFRHRLSELRESGSIEQDSDVVMFIVRQTQPAQPWDDSNTRSAVLQVAKQREGPTGEMQMYFSPEKTEFLDSEPSQEVPF